MAIPDKNDTEAIERRHDRRYLETLTEAHEKVHSDEKERVALVDEGHWRQHEAEHKAVLSWEATHLNVHGAEQRAIGTATTAEAKRLEAHREAHEAAHFGHEALHVAYDKAHVAMHESEQRALLAASHQMDKRLDSMNQFREQMRDQAAAFVQVEAFDAFKDERRHALTQLDTSMDKRYEELRALIATEREERREAIGSRKGATENRNSIYAAIGIVGTVLAILIVVMNLFAVTPAVVVGP